MKNLQLPFLLFLFLIIFISSCEKTDPEPPLAEQIMGEYTVDYYLAGTTKVTLPATVNGITATGTLSVSKLSETEISVLFTFIQTASDFGLDKKSTSTVPSISLSKNSSGEIGGQDADGNSIGFSNGELRVKFNDSDPSSVLIIYASRSN
ncbi:MAG: hypothetical protein NXI00_08080 [Cytophagales bacterium]|nr:hypothetical protein [Cytophagales bacterium]